jgi:fimbrial isopeptide formation D2 family protein/LPXTG-motif cell wall-anchored protein
VIDDYMTPGLTLYSTEDEQTHAVEYDIVVTVDGTPVVAGANTYTISNLNSNDPEDPDFTITFAAPYVTTLDQNSEVIITYSAIVNENAVVKGTLDASDNELLNTNDVTLTYLHWESTDSVGVETYEFDLVKTMNETYSYRLLNGAEFKLYDALTNGHEIPLVLEETIYEVDPNTGEQTTTVKSRIYRKALAGETPVDHIDAGVATIRGLGNGTYYAEETVAPDGYNKLQTRQAITINSNNQKAAFLANGNYDTTNGAAMQVINSTGSVLPGTGGMGTYLFYGIGAILVVGAVVVLVSKKRMRAYSE